MTLATQERAVAVRRAYGALWALVDAMSLVDQEHVTEAQVSGWLVTLDRIKGVLDGTA